MEKEYFEILLEDMRSKFQLVIEGQESLRRELKHEIQEFREETQEKFDMIAYMIERLQQKDIDFEKRFDTVDQRFDTIDERFNTVDERFNAVDERFNAVDERFNGVDERFDNLESRFDKLEIDFALHRANTEIHTAYTVNEDQKGHEYL